MLLVFALLIYVYSLKLMFGALLGVGSGGLIPSVMEVQGIEEVSSLLAIYVLGYAGLSATIFDLYLVSYHNRDALELSAFETYETKTGIIIWAVMIGTGVLAALLALALPARLAVFSGFVYRVLVVAIPLVSGIRRRGRNA